MTQHISFTFGPFDVSCTVAGLETGVVQNRFFKGCETEGPADWNLVITASGDLSRPFTEGRLPTGQTYTCRNSRFSLGGNVITGTVDHAGKEVSIRVCNDFFSLPTAEYFQHFLIRFFYTMCAEANLQGFIIHGCGILKDNTPYLFIGHHGSGKTTIALNSGGTVLHDDVIILTQHKGTVMIDTPPLPARDNLRCRPAHPLPVQHIYFIKQGRPYLHHTTDPALALAAAFNEIISPLTLTDADNRAAQLKKASACMDLLKNVTVQELHCDIGGSFWTLLSQPAPSSAHV